MKMIFPNVPKKFDGNMPKIVNDCHGWSFTKLQVEEAAKTRSLLTLDVDMAGNGVCSLHCGHCFRRSKDFGKESRMDLTELMIHLKDAKKLGLKSVKLIGPGEPLEEPGLLDFIRTLKQMDITVLIFTKGYILGNDALCESVHGMNGAAMTAQLKSLDVTILLGATSFDPDTEDKMVGKPGFHSARNEAILRLVNAGFNDFIPGQATRLAFICAPVTPNNIGGVFDLYVWARERHIQPVIAPTMIAGRALKTLNMFIPTEDQLLDVYLKIHIWAIERGIISLDEITQNGIAAYAGGAACNQVAVGMFMRGDRKVLRCPGDDISIQGDLTSQTLVEIWEGSENLRNHSGQFNNGCPPKEGKSFPEHFFEKLRDLIIAHFAC